MTATYKPANAPSIDEQAQLFKALGNATRLHILRILDGSPGKVHVDGIVERLCTLYEFGEITQPTVSNHLRVLLVAKLIKVDHKVGKYIFYRVRHETLAALREALG